MVGVCPAGIAKGIGWPGSSPCERDGGFIVLFGMVEEDE